MIRPRIAVAALLCLVGGILSLILLSKHYGVPLLGEAALAACGEGGGCDIVDQSRYAKLLSYPLAAWGLLFYGSVLALLAPLVIRGSEDATDSALSLAFFLVAAAVVIDVALLGLQAFVIKAFCKFCIATYGVNLALLFGFWPFRQIVRIPEFLFGPKARPAALGWVFASLAVATAAIAGNNALETRKALAGSSILGVPTMLQAPEKVEKGSIEEQLALARAEAKKWKDTLDNEQSLQVYLTQKAKDDFNRAAVLNLDLSKAPSKGAGHAPIVVVTYSDFMCPFCRDLAGALKRYLPTTGERIQLRYKNFPLEATCNAQVGRTIHAGACDLALGGICAADSGRFWEYHDQAFLQTWMSGSASRDDVVRLGVSAGLDAPKMRTCMDSAATRGRLAADVDEGWRIGVGSTPTVIINGRRLQSANVFLLAVEEERKRLNLPPLTPASPLPNQ